VGLFIEMFLLTRLKKKYKTLAGAVRGMTVLLFTIMGIYGAVHTIPMDRDLLVMLRTVLHVTMILAGTVMLAQDQDTDDLTQGTEKVLCHGRRQIRRSLGRDRHNFHAIGVCCKKCHLAWGETDRIIETM
jgi:hypothetical protein